MILVGVIIDQLYIYRGEIKNRQRPWIGRSQRSQSVILVARTPNSPPYIVINLVNNGEMPAKNVTFSDLLVIGTFTEELNFDHTERQMDYGPKEDWAHRMEITDQEYSATQTGTLSFATQCKYTDHNNLNGIFEIRAHYTNTKTTFDSTTVK